jgi:AcrR family transcriptional regulator
MHIYYAYINVSKHQLTFGFFVKLNTEIRQKQIIESSMEIIQQRGIQNLTIKEISKKIGISEQAIYRHFKNKLAILLALIEYFNENLKNSFNHNTNEIPPLKKIQQLTKAHMDYLQSNPSTAAIIFSEEIFRNESVLVELVNQSLQKRLGQMSRLIALAIENSEVKSSVVPENMALVFLGSLRLLVKEWQMSDFSFDLVERGEKVITELIDLIKV